MHRRLIAAFAALLAAAPALADRPPGINIPPYAQFAVKDPLPMVIRSAIPGVPGRIDKIAFDDERYLVFLAATRLNMVLVQNLATHKVDQRLKDLPEPRAIAWMPRAKRLLVACGGDGSLRVFKADSLSADARPPKGKDPVSFLLPEHDLRFVGEADGLAIEEDAENSGAAWVAYAMAVRRVNPVTGEKGPEVTLPGRADGMVFGRVKSAEGGETVARLFVNVPRPDATEDNPERSPLVLAIDPATAQIVAKWKLEGAAGINSIALDEENGRLFVYAKSPAEVHVLDASSGERITRFAATADADEVVYDRVLQRLFIPGGGEGGKIGVFQRTGVGAPLDKTPKRDGGGIDTWERVHTSQTNAGARTAAFSEKERVLVVAAPSIGTDPVFFYVYIVGP